jgi:transposase-like protein
MTQSIKHQRYSKKVKLEAIRLVMEEDERVQAVCDRLGIRHRDNVYEWIKKYKKYGESAFDRTIGRPMNKDTSVSTDERVDRLQLEVDALKKYLEILRQRR